MYTVKWAEGYPVDMNSLKEICDLFGESIPDIQITARHIPGDLLVVERAENNAEITYGEPVMLFRGLGLLHEHRHKKHFHIRQKKVFSHNGVMLDCSRNGVMKPESVRKMIRHMALMGLDTLMLYTEDTYTLPEYPYFGYMRGRYTTETLREMDGYARQFGVELVPCIQTLAHLPCALRWNSFTEIIDTGDILLADDDKTYTLIEAMLNACQEGFSTKRIHIGMDEAHMVGLGKYRELHGNTDRTALLSRHLSRVTEICRQHGFSQPMMWSDMFFRLVFGGNYGGTLSPETADLIPKDVQLVYWDYYATEGKHYGENLVNHQALSDNLAFAGGAWRWTGYTPNNTFSLRATHAALTQCQAHGMGEVFVTAWGDNGNEASFFTILPVMQLYAEYGYGADTGDEALSSRLAACSGESLADMLLLDLPNRPGGKELSCHANPSKYLLYQDVLCGLFDRHVEAYFPAAYVAYETQLRAAARRSSALGYVFETLADLCGLLSVKLEIVLQLKKAYDGGDREALYGIAREQLPECLALLKRFHESVSRQWRIENQIFGLDVLDLRLGGLRARLEAALFRLEEYLSGGVDSLEELEQKRLPYTMEDSCAQGELTREYRWHYIASTGVVAGV